MFLRLLLAFSLLFVGYPLNLQAASPPDSGQILQEQQQAPPKLHEQLPIPEKQKSEQVDSENDQKITVSGFTFVGIDKIATKEELQKIVNRAIGKATTLSELQKLVTQVTNYLHEKGYFLARAYLPKQEIIDGMIQIAIVTGQVEGVPTIQLLEPSRLKKRILISMATAGAPPGEAIEKQRLERAMLLINDLPGISAKSILEKGSTQGTTSVFIEAQEGPLFNSLVSVNNFGNRYTGTFQGVAQIDVNDLSGFGDQFSLSLTGAEGLQKGGFSYQLPLGSSGLKGELNYTGLCYELGKDFKSLDAEGTANTITAQLSYPMVRTRAFSLWQAVNYEYRNLDDEVGNTTTSDRTLDVVSTNTTLNNYDKFGGGGLTNSSLKISLGELDYGLASEAATDSSTANADGHYMKVNASLSRLQRLSENVTLFGALSGQLASQNLDSSEKFILGGSSGIRSYPVGEASGDEGFSLSNEIRYNIPKQIFQSNLQLVAFFDTGRIKLHNSQWTNSVTNATGKNIYTLSGLGFGVNFDKPGKYSLRASCSHVIGSNPGRSTDGKNADNKDNDQQIWLQAILWF